MKKLLGILVISLVLIIFSNTAQAGSFCRNNEKIVWNEGKIGCAKKSLFDKAGDALEDLNPISYFEKRKKCQDQADRMDTVAEGKRRYKNCMKAKEGR